LKLPNDRFFFWGFRDLLGIPYTLNRYTQNFEGKRETKFKSKIVLLIDSGCASSCETIVEKLSAHSYAILVGQNTMGALHFSNAVTFMLPNSDIITKVPTLFHKYEFDATEGEGYSPTIRLDFIIDLEMF
jgi:C-terminal processing protease CtpA/Prc